MSHFAQQLKALRNQYALSMQDLADKANVSKSMICKIENEEVQPTIDVAAKLSHALGKSLSEMLHVAQTPKVIHLSKDEQAIWEDAQHVKRRNISPVFEGLKIEWLFVNLPAKTHLSVASNPLKGEKHILIVKGSLDVKINQQAYHLKKGDSLYFDSSCPHEFSNPNDEEIEYYIVLRHD